MFEVVPWLILLAVLALIWWRQMGARTAARRAARAACADAEVRFIDEVAFKRIGFTRDEQGRWRLTRYYGFEFYQRGDRRYTGTVEMYGQRVNRVYMGPRPL
jgi:hypothetical protein